MTVKDRLFWLHIKKSAGQSTRRMLAPLYKQVDRSKRPASFIQSPREDWNDILNNYRVPLGDYQFRRTLFAREHLYREEFDRYLRVAFAREPVSRAVSQFFYLWHTSSGRRVGARLWSDVSSLRFTGRLAHDFDRFLHAIEACRASPSHFGPEGLHFQTHTAAMWDDIVDDAGAVLLDHVFRLEDLANGVNRVREALGHPPLAPADQAHVNRAKRASYTPTAAQKRRLEALFGKDFEIFEGHCERL
ncbi:MAG: sulfotransferase family 2 domain-containing protein [Pseudomonadota bacterium]